MRWLEVLAIGIYTLELTGSALIVALMFVARTLPAVFLGAITGALASRVSRKLLLGGGMVLSVLTSVTLLFMALSGTLSLTALAIGSVINGVVWTLEHPVRRTMLGDVAGKDSVRQAMSLDAFSVNSTRMFGPIAGGGVYGLLGMSGVFSISTIAFSLGVILVLWARVPDVVKPKENEGVLQSLSAGLQYILGEPVLRAIMIVTIVANFFGFSYASMVPVIGKEVLSISPVQIGFLQSMEGMGATVSALFFATTSLALTRFARTFAMGAVIFFVSLLLFAQSSLFIVSSIALFAAGIGLGTFSAMQSTALLNKSDPTQRTRVMGVLVTCIGAGPAGVLAVGALADWIGPTTALLVMTLIGLCFMGASFWRYPSLSAG